MLYETYISLRFRCIEIIDQTSKASAFDMSTLLEHHTGDTRIPSTVKRNGEAERVEQPRDVARRSYTHPVPNAMLPAQ